MEARPCDDAVYLSSATLAEPSLDVISLRILATILLLKTLYALEKWKTVLCHCSVTFTRNQCCFNCSNCWLEASECVVGQSERDVTSSLRATPAEESLFTGEIRWLSAIAQHQGTICFVSVEC